MSDVLDLIATSAAPLDAKVLQAMFTEVEDTPCHTFGEQAIWETVYENTEYLLIQAPDDSLAVIPMRSDTERRFWFQTLGIRGGDETPPPAPNDEEEEYEWACIRCHTGYDESEAVGNGLCPNCRVTPTVADSFTVGWINVNST